MQMSKEAVGHSETTTGKQLAEEQRCVSTACALEGHAGKGSGPWENVTWQRCSSPAWQAAMTTLQRGLLLFRSTCRVVCMRVTPPPHPIKHG